MVSGIRQSEPLTPTLSPQGRGGEGAPLSGLALAATSPLRGEVDAQRRVRGSVSRARALRFNSTDAEGRLWQILRARQLGGHKFVRQFAIGPYFADFVCRELALVVELDGGQHFESMHDAERTAYLNAHGYSVLRFWNNEVLENMDGVHGALASVLALNPSPDLRFAPASPAGPPSLKSLHRSDFRALSSLSPQGRGVRGASAATAKKRSYRLNAEDTSE